MQETSPAVDLDMIRLPAKPGAGGDMQAWAGTCQRLLKIRRNIMDYTFAIRKKRAELGRYEATIDQCREQAEAEQAKPAERCRGWVLQDLEARQEVARCQIEYGYEQIAQWDLEIEFLTALLIDDGS